MSSSPALAVLDHVEDLSDEFSADLACGDAATVSSLVAALSAVPDPRHARGVRHPVLGVLAITACAAMSGARSYAAISEWAAHLGHHVLTCLGCGGPRPVVPCESTLRRLLQAVDPAALEAALAGWVTSQVRQRAQDQAQLLVPVAERRAVIAIDGKTLRGSAGRANAEQVALAAAGGGRVHLVAAYDHASGVVLGEVAAASTGGEVAAAAALIADLDARGLLAGAVITADAAHTQRAHAELLHSLGGHYLFTVKGNQPRLLTRIKTLPWAQVPQGARIRARGHGRTETRTIRVLALHPCPDRGGDFFPHATQVMKIIRRRRSLTGRWHTETVYAITSLDARQAHPALLAGWVRGHWGIENRLHWVRDHAFDEDRSQIRTGAGPHVMATFRNLAITVLRLTGWNNITAGLRQHARQPLLPLISLGLT